MLSSILRIIEGVQDNDVEKVIRYSKRILPIDELNDELTEKCIREMFDPNASRAVMDSSNDRNELIRLKSTLLSRGINEDWINELLTGLIEK